MKQRVIKSEWELDAMRKIGQISSEAHKYVMKKSHPGMTEFKYRELFKLYCGMQGAPHEAYASICGCEANAATLHYVINDRVCKDGELILNDMGARGNGYVADITCTFPVNGKFTQKQKEIYNIVLDSNKRVEAMLKPGLEFKDAYKESSKAICEGLIELGLITTDIDTAMEKVNSF